MAVLTRPHDGNAVAGDDGPYDAQDWRDVWHNIFGHDDSVSTNGPDQGVLLGVENNLRVVENSPADKSVDVATGAALVRGMWLENTAIVNVVVAANVSGSTRIDVIVAQYDTTAGIRTGSITIVQGTPGAGIPALTQTISGIYQIPLAVLTLVNGYGTVTDAVIQDARNFANALQAIAVPVQNKSAQVFEGGDVVVYDSTNDSGVTTSTSLGTKVAGVFEGYAAINGWGRIITKGIARVRVDAVVARGDRLVHSTTATAAIQGIDFTQFATALEATAGAGFVLAIVDVNGLDQVVTTKGDVLTRNAADLARLAVGTNGFSLVADSAQAVGLKWGGMDPAGMDLRGVQVYNSANLSAVDAVEKVLTFDSENWDSNAYHDLVTNSERLTVPSGGAGKYATWAKIHYSRSSGSASDNGKIALRLYKNGTEIARWSALATVDNAGTPSQAANIYYEVDLAETDYLELRLFQDNTSSVTYSVLGGTGIESMLFGMHHIGV